MSTNMAPLSEPHPSLITLELVIVAVVVPLVSLAAIGLRFRARRIMRAPLLADDWWIVASWVCSMPLSVLIWTFGALAGVDHYKVDIETGTRYSREIAILLFFKRLFPTPKFRIAVWIAIGVITGFGILFLLLFLLLADPISHNWTSNGRYRYDPTAVGEAQVATSIALDVVVLLFPIPIVAKLHMSLQRRLIISFIFWLGAFCCVAAIVRVILLHVTLRQVVTGDPAVYTQTLQVVFLILEPHLTIISGCLPSYGTLMGRFQILDSIINSVRSFSRLSRRKASAAMSWRRGSSKVEGARQTRSDSTYELDPSVSWPGGANQNYVAVAGSRSSPQSSTDIEAPYRRDMEINVTTAIEVARANIASSEVFFRGLRRRDYRLWK
ncbi:hypothetical protein PG999_007579 [Apiospora kogelbergensis]|uniref:Rhodopsin domain-containing protein n=1 Tax=Apiospora kogelbergensis TaxID=1337665 RepID=A0AAW0QMM8_9PEZI